MGFFDSERKVSVSTTTVRLIENNMLPNSIKVGAIKSIYEEGDMTDYILEELINNVTNKAKRAYKYAKNNSHLGVPSEVFIQKNSGTPEVLAILKGLYGDGGVLHYSYFGVPNFYHFGWEALVKKGYNTVTNKLNGKYLDYFALEFGLDDFDNYSEEVYQTQSISPYSGFKPWSSTDTFAEDFYPPINKVSGLKAPRLLVVSGLQEKLPDPVVTYKREYLSLPALVSNKDYFQACYEVNGKKIFWSYRKGSGAYPVLDNLGETVPSQLGSYYPFIHFVHDKKILYRDPESLDYKLTKKLCKIMSLDADGIFEQIDFNPDAKELNQAAIIFAIPANSTAEAEQAYGFEFFKGISEKSNERLPTVNANSTFKRKTHTPGRTLIIADKKMRMSVSFGAVIVQRKSGVIEGRGKYHSSVGEGSTTYETKNPVTGMVQTETKTGTIHRYFKQVTPGLYDEIQVVNLRIAYKVFEDYSTTADGNGSLLLLPLDREIVNRLPVGMREQVVARSLRFVFNSYQIDYIQFYEKGVFKYFVMAIAIVFTIYSAGTGASFLASVAAGGTIALTAIWSTLVLPILQTVLVTEGSKLFVKAFGEDFAIFTALAAIAYGVYSHFTSNSLFAENLLKISNGLVSATRQSLAEQFGELQQDFLDFQKEAEALYEQLEETSNELLGSNLLAMVPEVIFGETPKSYFNRTIHAGNVGAQSMAMVSNYVDLALKLPSFNDSINLGTTYERL